MTDIIFENKEKGLKIRHHQTGSITIELEFDEYVEWKILSQLELYEMYQSLNELFAKVEITDFPKPDGTIYKHIAIPFNEEKRYLVKVLRNNINEMELGLKEFENYDSELLLELRYAGLELTKNIALAKSILKKIEEGEL